MGWSSGVNFEGRTVGYGHEGVCEYPDCNEKIDLGLGYCCGELSGVMGERGCGHYFCGEHLLYGIGSGQRCVECYEKIDAVAMRLAEAAGRDPHDSEDFEERAEEILYDQGALYRV